MDRPVGSSSIGMTTAEHREPVVSPRSIGPWLSASGSAIALVVTGVSLWETVLKQPQINDYPGESLFYTRAPWGSYEVFVVPITVMNSGAQDGSVLSMRL